MKRSLKQIFFLFFAFSFAINIVDCILDDQASFHIKIASGADCPEIPTQPDDSHVYHFDDVLYFGSEIQKEHFLNFLALFTTHSFEMKSNYLTCIWQPPKRA
jgi:hypothetical protein